MRRRIHLILLLTGVLGSWPAGLVLAQEPDFVLVTLEPGQTLRGLAAAYLKSPDAWPEILRANLLSSPHELHPGMRLRIPVALLAEIERTSGRLRRLIYQATEAGAQVFATDAMAAAAERQAEAQIAQRDGELDTAARQLQAGIEAASLALTRSLEQRSLAVQAVVDKAGGRVQRQRPALLDWEPIAIRTLLAERERVRTLSSSFALLRFRDASSLRMGENAQVAIRRLRLDRLTHREQVDLVLYDGDVLALIEAGAGRQAVNVEVPGIETGVRSKHYWLQRTRRATSVANYDGEIELSAHGGTVVVGENQGTQVRPNAPPAPPVELPPPPSLETPRDGARLYERSARFTWGRVPDAGSYWLEVARDRDFTDLVFTRTGIRETDYVLQIGDEGVYYWRLSSVDAAGLPGPAGRPRLLRLSRDETPPYLTLTEPPDGYIAREPQIRLSGQTEQEAALTLDGRPVHLQENGVFSVEQPLAAGENRLVLEARDPAGNRTRIERRVDYVRDAEIPLRLSEGLRSDAAGRLFVSRPWLTLEGETSAGSLIRLSSGSNARLQAGGRAGADGRFSLTLPIQAATSDVLLEVTTPAGQRLQRPLSVVLDTEPPEIALDARLPARTADAHPFLSGRVEPGADLSLGGTQVAVTSEGRFEVQLSLRPGPNPVVLVARDLAGNAGTWQGTIVLDRDPPRLDAYRLKAEGEGAERVFLVEIVAEDPSGLTAGVPYRIQGGDLLYAGVARRCPDRACYRDRVRLPGAAGRQPRLVALTLQDYLGNRREIDLD